MSVLKTLETCVGLADKYEIDIEGFTLTIEQFKALETSLRLTASACYTVRPGSERFPAPGDEPKLMGMFQTVNVYVKPEPLSPAAKAARAIREALGPESSKTAPSFIALRAIADYLERQ